jgi:dephospho-CoA kinase
MDSSNIKILGVGGTNGSGKDTLSQILADEYNYLFISVSDLLREELRRRGLEIKRENTRILSAEWRREFGLGVLIDKAVEQYNSQKDKYAGIVMASLRNPGEVDRVHELNGKVIWLDAEPKLRYERIQANAHTRNRQGEDQKTYEEFLKEEDAEMRSGGDETTLHMQAVKDKADIFIDNNQSDMDVFKKQIAEKLGL